MGGRRAGAGGAWLRGGSQPGDGACCSLLQPPHSKKNKHFQQECTGWDGRARGDVASQEMLRGLAEQWGLWSVAPPMCGMKAVQGNQQGSPTATDLGESEGPARMITLTNVQV